MTSDNTMQERKRERERKTETQSGTTQKTNKTQTICQSLISQYMIIHLLCKQNGHGKPNFSQPNKKTVTNTERDLQFCIM